MSPTGAEHQHATPATRGHLVVHRPDGFTLDVELELPAGRTTALLGPNGAGKSTALAALAGLLPLDAGRLEVAGRTVDDPATDTFVPAAERHVGVVFQDGRLLAHLSVLDNVAFGPRSRGSGRRDARRHAMQWLERLGVADLADRRPDALSGGQAQRVALGRALATDPDLVLLDEPLSALDVTGRTSLRRELAQHLGGLDAPRLLVTHDPVEAFLLADRVALLEGGRITQVGTPDDLRQQPRTAYAADLVGTNLLHGRAGGGSVSIGDHRLRIADTSTSGPVLVAVHPHAVALSLQRPDGSPRNTWRATIDRVERLGDRTRVSVGAPLPLTAEVTPAAVTELGLAPGVAVWLAVKATEVSVTADA